MFDRMRLQVAVAAVFGLLAAAGGCNWGSGDEPTTAPDAPSTAQAILDRMVQAYRKAKLYSDAGELHFRLRIGDRVVDDPPIPFRTAVERPDRLRVETWAGQVVADGRRTWATSALYDRQILVQPAPERATFDWLKALPVYESLGGPYHLHTPQIDLLLADPPHSIPHRGKPKQLDDGSVDEWPCYRIELPAPDGPVVYWIDKQTYVLRRFDFATGRLREQLDPEGKVDSLEVWAVFRQARFDDPVDRARFQFQPPPSARLVARLVEPPRVSPPLAPSSKLGHEMGDFSFVTPSGETIDRHALRGKVVVLDFWSARPPLITPQVARVYETYRDDPRLAFFAVNIDPEPIPEAELEAARAAVQSRVPVLRDPKRNHQGVFAVRVTPSTYVIGPDGLLQQHLQGFRPNRTDEAAAELQRQIASLLAGQSVVDEARRQYEQELAAWETEQARYERELGQAAVRLANDTAAKPRRLTLTPLWKNQELTAPGNVVIATDQGRTRLVVVDGIRALAELSADGKLVQRRQLDVPPGSGISFLRTAVDSQGRRRFVASAADQPYVYVLDENLALLRTFPNADEAAVDPIADVQLVHLATEGESAVVVGYRGVVGVQRWSIDGQMLWSNRALLDVERLAILSPGGQLHREFLALSRSGSLIQIDPRGRHQPHPGLLGWFPMLIAGRDGAARASNASADDAARTRTAVVALAIGELDTMAAIGLSATGEPVWEYPLASGIYASPVEPIVWGQLTEDGPGQWVLAAPDGTIHLVGDDGTPIDSFVHRGPITGLAVARLEGKNVLVVCTPDGIEALAVSSGGTR
jgi:peroxiredoxin